MDQQNQGDPFAAFIRMVKTGMQGQTVANRTEKARLRQTE